jgi:hypothetical protein
MRSSRRSSLPNRPASRGAPLHRTRFRSTLILASLAALLLPGLAAAQATARVQLSPPDTSKFPVIAGSFDPRDADGHFITGLKKDQVSLVENSAALAVDDLKEDSTPLEVSVALNPSASMAVYVPDGRTRYQVVAETLDIWASGMASGQKDRFNLFPTTADPATDLTYRSDWLAAFRNLPQNPPDPHPSLDTLTAAIQHAEETPPEPGSTRVLLWVTSPPEGTLLDGLPALVTRAQAASLRIFIWMVSPAIAFQTQSAAALQQACAQTGGQFFAYSGAEALPSLDDWFDGLRGNYTFHYTSRAHTAGAQSLAVRIQAESGTLDSAPVSFDLNLQPPNPILLSPPVKIERTCPEDCPNPAAQISPAKTTLRILVEFPDGHSRSLAATRLYVDGTLAAERTAEPFNLFEWDLSGLTNSGSHRIAVEAVDSLGMNRRSRELPIQVQVTFVHIPWWQKLAARPGFARDAALGAGLLVLIVAVTLNRRRIPGWIERTRRRLPFFKNRPVHSPAVKPASEPARASHRTRFQGQLVFLGEDDRPIQDAVPVVIDHRELTLGSDPARVDVLLEHPSVDRLHARLTVTDGGVRISDAGSVAGTWANYEPVPQEGWRLEHGDRICLGMVTLRYEAGDPPPPQQVLITKVDEDDDRF